MLFNKTTALKVLRFINKQKTYSNIWKRKKIYIYLQSKFDYLTAHNTYMSSKLSSPVSETVQKPDLFGQKHSSRDYSKPDCWGKNQFNSSFPASLMAYMSYKKVNPVYIKVDKKNNILHDFITPTDALGVDPLSDDAYYNYEAGFSPFEVFYSGQREKIDLVMLNSADPRILYRGLEVKLTALPDNTTKNNPEEKYGCEIVMRPPTICFLACSICSNFIGDNGRLKLQKLLTGVPQIRHWEEPAEAASIYQEIENAVMRVSSELADKQIPLIIQPVWKTKGSKMILADDCLDMFVWSNLAILQMCKNTERLNPNKINRFQRAIIWVYRMLFDYSVYGRFDFHAIIQDYAFGHSVTNAFSCTKEQFQQILSCAEFDCPRISKEELTNIISEKYIKNLNASYLGSIHPLLYYFITYGKVA